MKYAATLAQHLDSSLAVVNVVTGDDEFSADCCVAARELPGAGMFEGWSCGSFAAPARSRNEDACDTVANGFSA